MGGGARGPAAPHGPAPPRAGAAPHLRGPAGIWILPHLFFFVKFGLCTLEIFLSEIMLEIQGS